MNKKNIGLFSFIVLFILSCFAAKILAEMGDRHETINGQLCVAKHIYLPGFTKYKFPEWGNNCEEHFSLKEWAGTRNIDFEAINTNGTINAEATAGLAFLASGSFPGYSLKKLEGGHYELFKPSKDIKYFVWDAPYRVSKWRPATDMK